ncbi:MAG: ATP-binding protein [Clostridia bacterium]|nr:MAG: ATP-binding protein [Clostridia bacterium]
MNKCRDCQQTNCEDCPDFLSRGPLSQKPLRPVYITLEGQDGREYPAQVLILNTVELGLETNAPLWQNYRAKLLEDLTMELAPVPMRGRDNKHVFDILSVQRGEQVGEHLNRDLIRDLTAHLPPSVQELARAVLAGLLETFPLRRRHGILVCLSEALTNVVKHAQNGKWAALQVPSGLRLAVEDTGPGIKLAELPKATLMQHYSTKKSLGSGFTLMLYYSDRIYLATGQGGTSLILEFTEGTREGKLVC